jgi:iron complex outermembrane receptor protein
LKIPLLKSLEGDLQARYDKYSDFGSTFNPKASLRWEPIEQLMFRTSYSTGFRAPTLAEEHTPKSITFTNGTYNDPVLCPGGTPTANGQEARDCNTQFYRQNGGNPNLQPEKSKSFTLGTVIQPLKNLVFTIDYYNIRVTNEINALDESAIFAEPTKYAEKYVRNPDGSLNYIITTEQNLGGLHTDGIDMTAAWKSEPTAYGRFGVNLDGTYVHKYEFQTEKNGEWINNLGSYQGSGPNNGAILKWKHTLDLNWNSGNWSADATQFFHTGYVDQNPDGQDHKVSSYTIYGLSGTYKGIPHLDLTLGVKNLFNTEPPASNVTSLFQSGYDPRYSDALGRTYFIRGTYKFM